MNYVNKSLTRASRCYPCFLIFEIALDYNVKKGRAF